VLRKGFGRPLSAVRGHHRCRHVSSCRGPSSRTARLRPGTMPDQRPCRHERMANALGTNPHRRGRVSFLKHSSCHWQTGAAYQANRKLSVVR
jgi:hypothetical protein